MRNIALLVFATALCACEPTRTEDYYISHPDDLAADLAVCKQERKNTYNCNEASKADFFLRQKK